MYSNTILYHTVLQGTAVFDQPAGDEGQLYQYQSQTEHGMGPPVPELEELGSYGCVCYNSVFMSVC